MTFKSPPNVYWFSSILYQVVRLIVIAYASFMFRLDIKRHAAIPKKAVLFAANHPSATDPFLIHLHRRMSVMITENAFAFPVLGKLLSWIDQISVAPGGDSLLQAHQRLMAGRSVGIFPEGDFSPEEGGLLPPRSGAARLALRTGAPVIPVGIFLQQDRILRLKSHLNGKDHIGFWYWRGPYVVTIGEPMYFEGDPEDRHHVRTVGRQIMARIAQLTEESKQRLNNRLLPA
jgi:1-acyl-sn-glycerol-3-phosphate acyltransferase